MSTSACAHSPRRRENNKSLDLDPVPAVLLCPAQARDKTTILLFSPILDQTPRTHIQIKSDAQYAGENYPPPLTVHCPEVLTYEVSDGDGEAGGGVGGV